MSRRAAKSANRGSSSMVRLQTLPQDVIIAVLKRLDTPDRLRAGAACKALHNLVSKASSLWEEVEFTSNLGHEATALKAKQFMSWLLSKAAAVQKLTVTLTEGAHEVDQVDITLEARVWTHILAATVACREGLQSLHLRWDGNLALGPWLRGFPQLTSMNLTAPHLTLEEGLRNLPTLQDLCLSAKEAAHLPSLPTALTSLELDISGLETLPACLTTLQRLENLELQQMNLRDADFGALTTLTRLTKLSNFFSELLTVPHEISTLTRLECLVLGDPMSADEDLSVLTSLRQLQLLDVGTCNLRVPPPLAQLSGLRRLSAWDNALHEWPAGPWVGRLEMLVADLSSLARWTDALRGAHRLQRLFILRDEGQAGLEPLYIDSLLSTLRCLPALVQVAYVVLDDEPMPPEQRAFTNLLLVLAKQPHLQVDMLSLREVYDDIFFKL